MVTLRRSWRIVLFAFLLVVVIGAATSTILLARPSTPTGAFNVVGKGVEPPSTPGQVTYLGTVNASALATKTQTPASPHQQPSLPFHSYLSAAAYAKIKGTPNTTPGAVQHPPAIPPTPQTPSVTASFQGQSQSCGTPPDMALAVGYGYIVQAVNCSFAVYTTTGTTLLSDVPFLSLFNLNYTHFLTDPRMAFDAAHGRFILTVDNLEGPNITVNPEASNLYVAVSVNGNPTGSWYVYRFPVGLNLNTANAEWADFPQLGMDSQALYVSANYYLFRENNGPSTGAFVGVLPLAGLEADNGITFRTFTHISTGDGQAYSVSPAVTYGTPRTEFFVSTDQNTFGQYIVWSLSNPLGTNSLLTYAVVTGPAFSMPPYADQPGNSSSIETDDFGVGSTVYYRAGVLYFSITTGYTNRSGKNVAAVEWYEMHTVLSQGDSSCGALPNVCAGILSASFSDYGLIGYEQTTSAFYPSMGVDSDGNFIIDYTVSSLNYYPYGIANSHRVTMPLHTVSAAVSIPGSFSSAGYYQLRWGDYSATVLDPLACTGGGSGESCGKFWFAMMHTLSNNQWGTYIASDALSLLQP
jgi:hypothetical protein